MKKSKRYLAAFSAGLIILTAFSGCKSEVSDTSKSSDISESSNTSDSSGTGKAKLLIWDWDEAALKSMPEFYKLSHPDVEIETLLVPTTDYMQKFQTSLASGTDVPDVVLTEMAYRGRLFDLGVLEDLSKEPYNVKKEDMFDFAWDLGSGPNGELLGVEQQICPTGFAYRRDLAIQYLGTDNPDELATMLPDWDSFIEKGKEVVQKSDGNVVIYPCIDGMIAVLRYQDPSSYIDGDNINLTGRYKGMFELATKMNQAGILGNMSADSPALSSGFSEGKFIFYQCAPWAMKWSIQTNDPNGSGNWGLVSIPGATGTTNGGTSVSVYSKSEYKDAAWDYIKFTYCDGAGVEEAYKQYGFMSGFKAPYDDKNSYFFTAKGPYDDFFGGQKMTDYYINRISLNLKGQPQTKNESAVTTALNAVTPQLIEDNSITADKALELLEKELQTVLPDAKIQ